MPSISVFAGAAVLMALVAQVSAESTINLSRQTWYGFPDNGVSGGTSGSSATAFSCDGRGFNAGGDGSFDNPLTCAVAAGSSLHQACELFYFPYLEKYLVMQDTCGGCSDNQIDVWIGDGNGGSAEIDCENNSPSGDGHNLILNPSSGRDTNTNALWSSGGGCQVSNNVFPGNS